jgi:C-terminal processing protease CtpA/Prc
MNTPKVRIWVGTLAGLALAAVSCTLGGRVTEETPVSPPTQPPAQPTAQGQFPPAEIQNDEGGPVSLSGQLAYTYPFFTTGVAEPIIILEDQGGFVVRDRDFVIPVESQVLGQITSDFYSSPFTYSLTLPLVPRGTRRDVDQDGGKDAGVMVFAVAYWTNTWGDPYLEQRDQGGGGWSSAYASTRVSDDRDNYLEIYGGKLVVFSGDDQQGFPSGFGEDGLLFTGDDPIVQLPQGWTVVDLDSDPFTFDRSRQAQIDLLEPESLALDDFSAMSYSEAFDAMLEKFRTEYAFTELKGIDWDEKAATFRPRFVEAESSADPEPYYLALRDFLWSIPDAHVGMDFSGLNQLFLEETAGGLGMAAAELDDGRVLVNYLLEGGPADQAGVEFGAEILQLNGKPIGEVIEATVPWSSPFSTEHNRRLQQLCYALRFRSGTAVELQFRNPGGRPQTASLAVADERESFSYSSFQAGVTGLELPVEFKLLDEGYAYVSIFSFFDTDVLTIQLWERAMQTLNDNNIPGLIIDLRHNGGGNGYLARQMAAYFFSEELETGNTGYYDDSSGEFYFDPGDIDRMVPPREDLRYHGPIIALVGPACASACEFFGYSLTLEDRARVAGLFPTAGAGGSVEDFVMPLGVSVRFTIGRAVDPQGEIHIEGKGVVPDVPVPLTEENFYALYRDGQDIVLQAALNAIGKPRGAGVVPEGPPRVATRAESDDALAIQTPPLDEVAQETYEEELFQPDTRTYTIQMGESRDVLWLTGWCASPDQFNQNWDNIELAFTLDGQPVPLSSFSRRDAPSGGNQCRFYYVLLTDWPVGEHVVVTEMRFLAELNDGIMSQVYAPGSRFYEYHVYVTR